MANIKVSIDYPISDGTKLKFRTPCESTEVEGLVVKYPVRDGVGSALKTFRFVDAHGTELSGIGNVFTSDVLIEVLLDVTKGRAFIKNADTNSYIEDIKVTVKRLEEERKEIFAEVGKSIEECNEAAKSAKMSVYDIAVKNGFVGTEAEWLESLKGDKGDKGNNGTGVVRVDSTDEINTDAVYLIGDKMYYPSSFSEVKKITLPITNTLYIDIPVGALTNGYLEIATFDDENKVTVNDIGDGINYSIEMSSTGTLDVQGVYGIPINIVGVNGLTIPTKITVDDGCEEYIYTDIDVVTSEIKKLATEEDVYNITKRPSGSPNYIADSAQEFAQKVKSRQSGNSFSFAFMTDAHITDTRPETVQSAKHAGLALSIINRLVSLDFITHGGDYTWGEKSEDRERTLDDFDLYHQFIGSAASNVPNIYVMGNHDDLPYQPTGDRFTQKETFKLFGRKNRMYNSVWQSGCNYGYVDFEDKKVRVIYVDTEDRRFLESPDGVNDEKALDGQMFLNIHNVSKEQADFIAYKALDFSDKEDYSKWSVVVVSHVSINTGVNRWKYPSLDISTDNNGFRVNVACVADILKAYKNGESCKCIFFMPNADGKYQHIDVSYNFASVTHRVQNIVAAHGENHTIEGVVLNGDIISIGCPNIVNGREHPSGDGKTYTKTAGTATGTAFSVITVDKENEKIYADVYGAGYDQEWYYGTEQPEPTPDPEPDTPDTPEPTYTNLFDWLKVTRDYYIGDGQNLGVEMGKAGLFITDYIDVSGNSTIFVYTKNIHMFSGPYDETIGTYNKFRDANYGLRRVALYDKDKNPLYCTANLKNLNNSWSDKDIKSETIEVTFNGTYEDSDGTRKSVNNVVTDYKNNIKWEVRTGQNASGDVAYIRICSDFMSEDSVITINEEIE